MINVRKQAAYLGAILLFFQAVPLSLTKAYAETEESVDPQLVEAFRSHQPKYLNLNQSMIPSETETEVVQEFSFLEKTFRTTVGQPTLLRFTSTLLANEVLVRIPANGQIVEEAFSNGESIQHSHGEYWTLKTNKQQTTFELPVVFETAGQYFLTVDHDADHFYLEVEEGSSENGTIESDVRKETDFTDLEEIDVNDQKQDIQEKDGMKLSPIAIQPVIAAEKNLSIPDEVIAEEEARILNEIIDPITRVARASNWSQFRSSWNSSTVTTINLGNISFSSSILGDSLNTRSSSITINGGSLGFQNSGYSLVMSGVARLTINSTLIDDYPALIGRDSRTAPLIRHNGSGLIEINDSIIFMTTGTAGSVVSGQNINVNGTIGIDSGQATGASATVRATGIELVRSGTLKIMPNNEGGSITSTANSGLRPILSNAGSTIIIQTNRFSMVRVETGGRYSGLNSWNSIDVMLSGLNGETVVNSNSNPNDFNERYLTTFNDSRYNGMLFNASGGGWVPPPTQSYKLFFQTNILEAGNPTANSIVLEQGDSTMIFANPNEGYRFVKWEIISGTNARVANETAETTTFTMGSSDAVVRAVYEKNTYSLSLRASPAEGGAPSADEDTLIDQEETEIHANPNEGYRFVSWEILSGTGARLADETAETTTFTMGSSDVVLQANYEEEAVDVRPLDPLDPEKEVDPENPPTLPEDQGLFSLDFASQFDFDLQAISAQNKTYYAKPQRLLNEEGTVKEDDVRPNYVQVSDRRSAQERDGWELSVRQNEQFHTATGQELTGARLVLQNQQIATAQGGIEPGLQHTNPMTLIPGGAKRTLLKAQGPEGEGTWIYRFGNAETAAQSVALEVPKGATPTADHYKTTLTWELSSVPKN
ncbi:WxL domain-containing protein [Enterococcus innesii]|uniref:WxL domain-containing protein n=1 Tax=Enterococcus innesii TaxID=2839759 RepID=UPI003984D16A